MSRREKAVEAKTETKTLIDEAQAAAELKAQADTALATSQQEVNDSAATLAEKSQAVYDDLIANGVALYIKSGESGDEYFVATAEHPASYTLTPIRIA